jgi:hypothetical protein
MSCNGHCYDVVPLEAGDVEETPLLSSYHEPTAPYVYSPLKPAQTRIIRLHPTRDPPEGSTTSLKDDVLYADLVTVNLHILEGAMIDGTTQTINYTALSYHWGHPELSETLVCDGRAKPISHENAMALRALRHPTETVNLWIDALCINQDDKQEKSEQVAHMLAIYKKAQWVTAWLGDSDSDSLLAFACVPKLPAMKAALAKHHSIEHRSSCDDQLMAILLAVLDLFGRPWLGRTWIRQEVYGARQLIVQCGENNISWQDFVGLDAMMCNIMKLQPDWDNMLRIPESKVRPLLQEAHCNADVPLHGAKPPRDLVEVLLESREFKFTDPRDTFYAVLGMCNVDTRAGPSNGSSGNPRKVVFVDYQKPLFEVYNDASFYIINNQSDLDVFVDLWHRYQRSPLHSQGLATWAVDWLSGVRSGPDWVRPDQRWLPLIEDRYDNGEVREWRLPRFPQEDRTVLRLEARVLNYVAHLTDYTCDFDDLPQYGHKEETGAFALGTASMSVHVDGFADSPGPWFSRTPRRPVKFDRSIHTLRLAILGVADTHQLCLVPSSASKGDLVVAVAPGMLPMLISPRPGSNAARGLYEPRDPWDTRPCDVVHTSKLGIPVKRFLHLWLLDLALLAISPLALIALFWAFKTPDTVLLSLPLVIGFGPILTILLVGHLTCTYTYVYTRCFLWDQNSPSSPFPRTYAWGDVGVFAVYILLFTPNIAYDGVRELTPGHTWALIGVYLIAVPSTILISRIWQHCAVIRTAIPIALRREQLRTLLDNVVATGGADYEFHGPLFFNARRYRCHQLFPGDRIPDSWHCDMPLPRWLFRFAVAVNNRTKGRPRVKESMESGLFARMSQSKGCGACQGYHIIDCDDTWSRPMQEFRIH